MTSGSCISSASGTRGKSHAAASQAGERVRVQAALRVPDQDQRGFRRNGVQQLERLPSDVGDGPG